MGGMRHALYKAESLSAQLRATHPGFSIVRLIEARHTELIEGESAAS